jgi:hypothetical protein
MRELSEFASREGRTNEAVDIEKRNREKGVEKGEKRNGKREEGSREEVKCAFSSKVNNTSHVINHRDHLPTQGS